jgi:hypothetical protein
MIEKSYRLGCDIGGTFTDFVLLDDRTGKIRIYKCLTTPKDPSDAVEHGIREMENQVRLVRPGDLGWDPKFGELTVTYGTAECRLPSGTNTIVVYGQIIEGLDEFASWARARRFEGLGELRFE